MSVENVKQAKVISVELIADWVDKEFDPIDNIGFDLLGNDNYEGFSPEQKLLYDVFYQKVPNIRLGMSIETNSQTVLSGGSDGRNITNMDVKTVHNVDVQLDLKVPNHKTEIAIANKSEVHQTNLS